LARTKKLRNVKIRVLTNAAKIMQRPASKFGKIRPIWPDSSLTLSDPVGSWPFWPDPDRFAQIRPDQWLDLARADQILAILARSSRLLTMAGIQQYSDQFRPEYYSSQEHLKLVE
jgi:hypothetical protein